MIEKDDLTIGDRVFFPIGKNRVEGMVIRKNKRSITVTDTKNNRVYRVPYSFLFKDRDFTRSPLIFEDSIVHTEQELNDLADEIKREYQHIFSSYNPTQLKLLESVMIKWNKRVTYRKGGYYRKSQNNQLINEITVSSSFKNAPKEVIKLILFHELLHIKYFNHSKDFRVLEQSFSNFRQVNEIMNKILVEYRIKSMKK